MGDNAPENADINILRVCDIYLIASTKIVLVPIRNHREGRIHIFAIKQ